MVKSGLTSDLASSVAALAASAANAATKKNKEKPAARQHNNINKATPAEGGREFKNADAEQGTAISKSLPKKRQKQSVDEGEYASAAPLATDQTRVLVSGLSADTTASAIEDVFSDAGPVRHIKVSKGGKATVHFVLATDAARCVKSMQGLEIAGNTLKLSLGESEDAAAVAPRSSAQGDDKPAFKEYTKLNTRLFRLVIRNLPFGIKEAAVRSAFETFGTLEEVHLPVKVGHDQKEQTRGFGFLQYSSRTEAKRAVDEGNGMQLLGRPVAVDWAVAKEIYQEQIPLKKVSTEPAKAAAKEKACKESTKEVTTEAKKAAEADGKKRKVREGDASLAEQSESKRAGVEGKKKEKAAGGEDKEQELARTVFIRNIPLEAEEHELREAMHRFGKIVFCKLVMDKVSGKHKGTAFCKFQSDSSANAACAAGAAFTGTDSWEEVQRKKDKRLQGSAVRGVLDDFKETLSMSGRHLFVALAVDRDESKSLKDAERAKLDRRNLYLAKEGVILEDSPLAKDMPPQDLAKRLRDWQEKKTKLANSNFAVNRTRLSVRNVSKALSEAQLKSLFYDTVVQAASAADKQGRGSRRVAGDKQGSRHADREEGDKLGAVKVVSANLVQDKTKIDAATGKPVTKGYGFVEFTEHAHALMALRRLNNCAATGKKHNGGKRLMIDFALDDARILRQRRIKQVRVERAKRRRADAAKELLKDQLPDEEDSEHPTKKLGRGALQRLKKRERAPEDDAAKGNVGGKRRKTSDALPDGKGKGAHSKASKVGWGVAVDSEGKSSKDLSKPYRERGNKVDGLVRAGAGRRASGTADPRAAAAAARGQARGEEGRGAGGVSAGGAGSGSSKAATKISKAQSAARQADAQLFNLVSEVGDVMPKPSKSKSQRNRDKNNKEDGLDKLVKQYTSSLFTPGGDSKGGRWFE